LFVQLEKERREGELQKETFRPSRHEDVNESLGIDDNNDLPCSSTDDPDYHPTRNQRKPKKMDKIMLELPTIDLTKNTADLCARLKLSHASVTSLFAKIILSGEGKLKDFVLSKSSTFRHRIIAEKETEKKLEPPTPHQREPCKLFI